MSVELIIIIVGILFILFALVYSKDSKLKISMGIIGVILIIFGGYTYGTIQPIEIIEKPDLGNQLQVQYPVEKVQIISPIEGDSVNCRILTKGVYPLEDNKDIWVLLKPSDNKYYPQSDYTNTSYKRKGEWQVITRFGGDQGELYDIIVYETDSTATQYFSSTIEKWKEANAYPGLEIEDLPNGAMEIERITVALKENCRGVH